MTLTQKESSFLSDLKSQEELCIEKYANYSAAACDPQLKALFEDLQKTEREHLDTVNRISGGEEVKTSPPPTAVSQKFTATPSSCSAEAKKKDAYLCKDALSMEKHVSSLYDTAVFEFTSPVLRDTLSHIQKEEQIHGERIYEYMKINGMYS